MAPELRGAIRCQEGVSARSMPPDSSVRPATTGTTDRFQSTGLGVAPVAAQWARQSSLEFASQQMVPVSAEREWRGTAAPS